MKLNRSSAGSPGGTTTEHASATSAALLQGSAVFREGRADVSRIRERSRRKRIFRLFVIVGLLDALLWWRFLSHSPATRPFGLPTLPQEWVFWMPAILSRTST